MIKTLLVDADMLCYISSDEEEPTQYVLHSVRLMLEDMQVKTGAESMRVLLSSPINFRYKVNPDYKISRRDVPKPCHHQTIKNYLIKEWDAEISPVGLEADDYIAMLQNDNIYDAGSIENGNTCIASLDKDFLTVAGNHYKWRNHNSGEIFTVTNDDAEAYLCYQLLIGDKADSIISPLKKYKKDGSYSKSGWGHVAARDFLLQHNYEDMRTSVCDEYLRQGYEDEFISNYKLLAIGRLTHEQIEAE